MKATKPEVLLLGNGPSLAGRPFDLIPRDRVAFFGLNQSWRLVPEVDYHLSVDLDQFQIPEAKAYYDEVAKLGTLFHTGAGGALGCKIDRHDALEFSRHPLLKRFRGASRPHRMQPPLNEDGGVALKAGFDSGGSVTYVALQIAASMEFEKIWIVGLDGYDGTTPPTKFTGQKSNCQKHDRMWKHVPADVRERLRIIEPSWTAQRAGLETHAWPWTGKEVTV